MLGKLVKDRVTGYQGRVTGRAEYLTGCAQLLVQPNAKPDGEFVDGRWLDETRVELSLPVVHGRDLIEPLEKGLALLRSDPARFKRFNPENGWGSYQGLVDFVRSYLAACREHPDATVTVSR